MARPRNSRYGAWSSGDIGLATGLPDRSVRLLLDGGFIPAEAGTGRGAMRAIDEKGLIIAAIVGALVKAGIVLTPAARIVEAILNQGPLVWLDLEPSANEHFQKWSDADKWLENDIIIEIRDGTLIFVAHAHIGDIDPIAWQRSPLGRLLESDIGTIKLIPFDQDWDNLEWRGCRNSLVTVSINAAMAIRRAFREALVITPPE